MGPSRWVRFVVERIPAPDVSEGDRPEVTKIVDEILALDADRADADTTELASAIDEMVNDLYGLTKESGGGRSSRRRCVGKCGLAVPPATRGTRSLLCRATGQLAKNLVSFGHCRITYTEDPREGDDAGREHKGDTENWVVHSVLGPRS